MENKENVMDNYLLSLKLSVSKTGLKNVCHVALICTIYCVTHAICAVVCQEIEVVRFLALSHLCIFQLLQTDTKSNLLKDYYEIRKMGFCSTFVSFSITTNMPQKATY